MRSINKMSRVYSVIGQLWPRVVYSVEVLMKLVSIYLSNVCLREISGTSWCSGYREGQYYLCTGNNLWNGQSRIPREELKQLKHIRWCMPSVSTPFGWRETNEYLRRRVPIGRVLQSRLLMSAMSELLQELELYYNNVFSKDILECSRLC